MSRSTGTPLTIAIVLMLLLVTLAVGWQVLVWTDRPDAAPSLRSSDWLLLVLGSVFFLVVMAGLVWMCVWLVREMRLNQAQRAFLDAVTHEMKTPLASFGLYLDTLRRHELSSAKQREFMERMRLDLDRLEDTVGQVLAAAKAEEGRRTPFRRQVEKIGELLRRESWWDQLANRLVLGTAHQFQGDECDVIVFSPVVAAGMRETTQNWLASTENLLNVAITRARGVLHVVGDRTACQHAGGLLGDFSEIRAALMEPIVAALERARSGSR